MGFDYKQLSNPVNFLLLYSWVLNRPSVLSENPHMVGKFQKEKREY
jgi:hypothetical protein